MWKNNLCILLLLQNNNHCR